MNTKLKQLHQYLINNHYFSEAKELNDIINKEISDNTIEKLKTMCTPRYLGDLFIREFDSAYNWWNFLGEVSLEQEKIFKELQEKNISLKK